MSSGGFLHFLVGIFKDFLAKFFLGFSLHVFPDNPWDFDRFRVFQYKFLDFLGHLKSDFLQYFAQGLWESPACPESSQSLSGCRMRAPSAAASITPPSLCVLCACSPAQFCFWRVLQELPQPAKHQTQPVPHCLCQEGRKKQEKRNKWNQAAGLVTGAHNWGSQFLVQQNSQLFPHPRALGTFLYSVLSPSPAWCSSRTNTNIAGELLELRRGTGSKSLHLFLFPILFFPFCSLFQRNLCSRVTHTLPRHFCCQSWLTGHPRKELLPFPPKQPLLGMLLLSKVFFFWNKKISHVCKPLSWEGKRGERSSQLYLFKMNIKSRTKGHVKLNEFHNFHSFS